MAEHAPGTSIPPMILTIEIPDGPTVRLDVDPARYVAATRPALGKHGTPLRAVPRTSVTVLHQGAGRPGPAPLSVADIVLAAGAHLFWFCMEQDDRPAELGPHARGRP